MRRGGTDFAKIGNLRRGFIPATFTSWAGGVPPTPANLNLYAVGGAGSPEDVGGLPAVTVLPPQVSGMNLPLAGEASEDLVNWSTNGVTMTIPADQSGVPAGCRRQIFTAESGTTGKKFLRLRSVVTGL